MILTVRKWIPPFFLPGAAVLGICYGQQLMAHRLGGSVRKGSKGEYGLALLDLPQSTELFAGWGDRQQVWMSHRDTVSDPPAGFSVLASTPTCAVAAIGNAERKLYGVQFHPEVVHTTKGVGLLSNFLFGVCGCKKDWDPRHRVPLIEDEIRSTVDGRNVFFFVSGGVDSTVAFTLCLRALGPERVHGVYVDTGLMRAGELSLSGACSTGSEPERWRSIKPKRSFLSALALVVEPESKRHVIGEQFVRIQERIIESRNLLDGKLDIRAGNHLSRYHRIWGNVPRPR